MPDRYLFLQCRNLGDATISTGLINSLGKSFPEISIDVLTRSPFKAIFEDNPYINSVLYVDFLPMGAPKELNLKSFLDFLKQICRLRQKAYDVCLNTQGDFRENLIGRLVNPYKNISVSWKGKHIYNNLIKKGLLCLVNESIDIPEEVINVYDVNDYIAKRFGCTHLVRPRIFSHNRLSAGDSYDNRNVIGIHPGASQKCKLWDFDKWKKVIEVLLLQKCHVCIFCAPNQKEKMQSIFQEVLNNKHVFLHASNLRDFFIQLSTVRLLIGLDSFAVHAAYALGIPVVILCGANDYRLFAPPGATVVNKGYVCPFYPCYNNPKCLGSKHEFICMKAIEVNDVIAAVETL